jgi:hypothetical protein
MKPILISLLFVLHSSDQVHAQQTINPDTLLVQSDSFKLKGLLWQPSGKGPFPAIIFCHGSYETTSITAGTLSPGEYVYSLVIEGKKIDSRQMILTGK